MPRSAEALVAAADGGDARAKGLLATLVERDDAAAPADRAGLEALLARRRRAPVVGLTGAPGAGKSTLAGALAAALVERDPALRLAIVAVDPSSPETGGALLGDRTRIGLAAGGRVFVRSQASEGARGGLGRRTYPLVRLLRRLHDLVLVETVGVGQGEIDVAAFADLTVLVLQPLAGDALQHLKAGLMEVPDLVAMTKCDVEELARPALAELESALPLAGSGERPPVWAVSGRSGVGVVALAVAIAAAAVRRDEPTLDRRHVEAVVREAYGRAGLALLDPEPVAASLDDQLELALSAIAARLRPHPA